MASRAFGFPGFARRRMQGKEAAPAEAQQGDTDAAQLPDDAGGSATHAADISETFDLIEADLAVAARSIVSSAGAVKDEIDGQTRIISGIRADTGQLSARSEEANANASQLAEAIEELTKTSREIGAQIASTTSLAEKGRRHRVRGKRRRQRIARCGAEDRRRGLDDFGGGQADQPAGAQRHHRGGARGRGRQGVCRRRQRGEAALGADPARRPTRSAPTSRSCR